MRVSLRLILLAGAAAGTAALWHSRSDDRLQHESGHRLRNEIRLLEAQPAFKVPTPEYFDTHPLEGLKGSPFEERGGR